MKTNILKRVNQRVRIVKNGEQYEVQARHLLGLFRGMSEWKTLNTFSSMKGAVNKKNAYIVMILMREMNLHTEFRKRRTQKGKIGYK